MRPYGMARKSETAKYVQKFIADMNNQGRPLFFRTDNGGEFTDWSYVNFCDSAGIHREYTAPGKPQQNALVDSTIWRAMKGGHAVRREIRRLCPGIDHDQGLCYSVGLLSMLDKTTPQGMVATNEAVDAVRHKKPGTFGSRGQPTSSVGGHDGTPYPGRGWGIPLSLIHI